MPRLLECTTVDSDALAHWMATTAREYYAGGHNSPLGNNHHITPDRIFTFPVPLTRIALSAQLNIRRRW